MSEFAQNNDDVATITPENIEEGFSACQTDGANTMPFTTNYVNGVFNWFCVRIENVANSVASVLARLEALNGQNVGTGKQVFKQRFGDIFQFRTIRGSKGINVTQDANHVNILQDLVCCYSDLNFGGGAPSNTFAGQILIDDVTDPTQPTVYVWSCQGGVYAPLGAATPPPPPTTPTGDGFIGITDGDSNCDGTTSGTIDNTDPVYSYAIVPTTPDIQIDTVTVGTTTITPANYGSFSVASGETVTVTVSGTDPNAGTVSSAVTITWTDGTDSGTVVNIPVTLTCNATLPAPTVPSPDTVTVNCVDLPETFTGFTGVVSYSVATNIAPNPSAYTVTPNAAKTQFTVNGTGGPEVLTLTVSNGTTAQDADFTINVNGCPLGGSGGWPNSMGPPIVSQEDLGNDIQQWTTWFIETSNISACGWSISGFELWRITHTNGDPTEYILYLTGVSGNVTSIGSVEFTSSCSAFTTVTGSGTTRNITQVVYNALVQHITCTDGYNINVSCI